MGGIITIGQQSVDYINETAQTLASGIQDIAAATEEQHASLEEKSISSASLSNMAEELNEKEFFKIH